MAKFNRSTARPVGTSPIRSESTPSGRTYEGGAGYGRDAKSELFLLAVSNMVGEDTFYETGDTRDNRYRELVQKVAVDDSDWLGRFLTWLRSDANMRSASLVGALDAAEAMVDASVPGARKIVASVMQRADEPGEALAYWTSRHGRKLPKPVKRGIADAAARLYSERSLLKYDTDTKGFRFGDVLELVHAAPAPDKPWQGDLFRHAIDRRHGRENDLPETLPTLRARRDLTGVPVELRRGLIGGDLFRLSGMTWEAMAGWLQGPMDAAAWEAVIPDMGYMARLRNLRNFDEAGVSDEAAATVAWMLADPEQVARSRQLPFRFLSAYRAAPSLRWSYPLEQALGYSLANIPELPGRTLVLVDTSSSMDAGFSKDGTLMRWDAAALFGVALGQRCAAADVVSFSSAAYYMRDAPGANTKVFPLQAGESLLRSLERWKAGGWFLGGGTDTALALRKEYARHDRVVIVTDEQAGHDTRDVSASIPVSVPMYTWNLAGYQHGHTPSGGANRHTFAGLTDQAFRMIPLLEAGRNADWPF